MTGSIWFDLSPSLRMNCSTSKRRGTVDLRGTLPDMNLLASSWTLAVSAQSCFTGCSRSVRRLRSLLQTRTQWLSVWLGDTWRLMTTFAVASIKPVTFFFMTRQPLQPTDHPATTKSHNRISLVIFYVFLRDKKSYKNTNHVLCLYPKLSTKGGFRVENHFQQIKS